MRLYWVRPLASRTWLLYCPEHLPHPDALTKGPQPSSSLGRRLLRMGETKWAEYSRAPSSSFKGQLYRFGQSLIDKLPVQEKMWWRVEGAMQASPSPNADPLPSPSPSPAPSPSPSSVHVFYGRNMPDQDKRALIASVHSFMRKHKARWIVNAALAVPVLVLTIFPFVKLLLAWLVFRAVTHNRAYRGCRFLAQALPRATFQHDPDLLRYEQEGMVGGGQSQDFKTTMDSFIMQHDNKRM